MIRLVRPSHSPLTISVRDLPRRSFLGTSFLLVGTAFLSSACSKAPYVWASDVPAERARPANERTTIAASDVVAVTVIGHPELSVQYTVGADGTIAMPNLGSVSIRGLTVEAAQNSLQKSLKRILAEPQVSVTILLKSIEVTVMGEVNRTGKFTLKSGDGVAAALALAGGIGEFGNENQIYLVRETEPLRVRFRLEDLLRGGGSARAFALKDGDLIVVE